VGHWTTHKDTLHYGLLSIQKLEGAHFGENQCALFWKALETYNLVSKVGYFVLDNASNSDTAMKHLQRRLAEHQVVFDPKKKG
jgi:hypothetical protein